jgi:YHS domain-containing protein
MTLDLVCRAEIDPDATDFFTEYSDKKYFFCSAACKRKFDDHPDQFIQSHAREELGL